MQVILTGLVAFGCHALREEHGQTVGARPGLTSRPWAFLGLMEQARGIPRRGARVCGGTDRIDLLVRRIPRAFALS